jgi:hypothetical protein
MEGASMTTFTSEDLAVALTKWRSDLHDELCALRELGIPIPKNAFNMCFSVDPVDYEGMSNSESVDLIIQQAQVGGKHA